MTDLREAIALELRIGLEILNAHAALSDDQLGWLADAVLAILPDAEALAEVMVSVRRVLRGIAEHPRGDDVDRAAAGIALKLIDAALSKYWKGTGRAEA